MLFRSECINKLSEDFALIKTDISIFGDFLTSDTFTNICNLITNDKILEQDVHARSIIEVLNANRYKFLKAIINK